MKRRTGRLVATLAVVAAVTACTTTADGTPHPEPGGESSESSTDEEEAPRVADPLDASAFVAAPCSTLTAAQLQTFAVNPPGNARGEESGTPGCTWLGEGGSIGIGWLTSNKHGLSDTYRGGAELNAYFIETTVDGYPAVFADSIDSRADGYCGIVVGVSDSLTFYATESGRLDAEGACARAKQVATAAIATIREAN